ncbi:MAG: 3'(2'),5'-bisphosphate nucleotidase CysQ [Acidimicrobiales bacterium]
MSAGAGQAPPPGGRHRDDHELAGWLAAQARDLLVAIREGWPRSRSDWALEEEADRAAHVFLTDALAELRPADVVLSEEGRDDPRRLQADRVWIVDPLDGSNDFPYRGSIEWAVHVALVERGAPAAGAVALPSSPSLFGTRLSAATGRRASRAKPVVITSRSWTWAGRRIADALGGEVATSSSAGVKAMAVVAGDADVYVHPSPLYEWDTCAPVAVAQAAGLHVSALDGAPLRFNQTRPVTPGLVVCRLDLADAVLDAISG